MRIQRENGLRLLVIWTLTVGCLLTISKASKCDHNIINAIKVNFWNNSKCIPDELLRNGAYMSPGAIVRTTKNFFTNENITCVYADYQGSVILIYAQFNNNNSCPPQLFYVITAIEEPGTLYDPVRGEYFYYLYTNRFGVTAFYICQQSGVVGDPQAIIKVSAARGYDENAVLEACADLASVGIYVSSNVYNTSCAT